MPLITKDMYVDFVVDWLHEQHRWSELSHETIEAMSVDRLRDTFVYGNGFTDLDVVKHRDIKDSERSRRY